MVMIAFLCHVVGATVIASPYRLSASILPWDFFLTDNQQGKEAMIKAIPLKSHCAGIKLKLTKLCSHQASIYKCKISIQI